MLFSFMCFVDCIINFVSSSRFFIIGNHFNSKGGDGGDTDFTTFADWRDRSQSFERMTLVESWGGVMTGLGESEMVGGIRVSADYFRLLGVAPLLGRDFGPEEDRPETRFVVMLSHALWKRRFNSDPNIIGKPIKVSDEISNVASVSALASV